MNMGIEFWQFVASCLNKEMSVALLVVAESHGSSPGRAGYKMAVSANGELAGSIGGGVMEVSLVERAKAAMAEREATGFLLAQIVEQVHRKDAPNASGMICSGRQSVIVRRLTSDDSSTVDDIIESHDETNEIAFEISNLKFQILENTIDGSPVYFSKTGENEFVYQEKLGVKDELYIIGGGHCALALSEIALKLGFRVHVFDDRPELNTIEKNSFAECVTIIDSYESIAAHIPQSDAVYVVVMTLGYKSDAIVVRKLIDHKLKYFGVLGSKAKMATLLRELREQGLDKEKLARIRTPVGLAINSRTPEEIAVSIAAEIISVKNS